MLVITAFTLFQQAKFNSSTLLRSLTYSVALSVRQAQVYGTSVRGFVSAGSVTFGNGYGIQFPPNSAPYQYYLFYDPSSGAGNDGTRAADGTEDLKPPSPFTFGQGYKLNQVCTRIGSADPVCDNAMTLTVFFRRPNPEACISTSVQPTLCSPTGTPIYNSAYVVLGSNGNTDTRSIKITDTGQIAICKPNLNTPAALATC